MTTKERKVEIAEGICELFDELEVSPEEAAKDHITINEVILEALQFVKERQWQPIETAPKDGTEILICGFDIVGDFTACKAWWHDKSSEIVPQFDWVDDALENPTHWQPLPQLPEEIK